MDTVIWRLVVVASAMLCRVLSSKHRVVVAGIGTNATEGDTATDHDSAILPISMLQIQIHASKVKHFFSSPANPCSCLYLYMHWVLFNTPKVYCESDNLIMTKIIIWRRKDIPHNMLIQFIEFVIRIWLDKTSRSSVFFFTIPSLN